MRRIIAIIAALVLLTLGSSGHAALAQQDDPDGGPGKGNKPAQSACERLDAGDEELLGNISGPGEIALKVNCGKIARPAGNGAAEPSQVDQDSAAVADVPALGLDLLVNNRVDVIPQQTQSEVSIVKVGSIVLTGFNDSGNFFPTGDFSGYSRSVNGGATWLDMGPPTTPLGALTAVFGDPVLAADINRTIAPTGLAQRTYFANLADTAGGVSIIGVHRSDDVGATWSFGRNASPLAGAADFQDKEWMTVDSRAAGAGAGNVYVCWRRFGGGEGIRFSRSTDGGLVYTEMAANLSASAVNVQGCVVAVSPTNGNVYVAWKDANFAPPQIRFRRSTDNGVTFGAELTIGAADVAETTTVCGGGVRTTFVDSEVGFGTRAVRSSAFPTMSVSPVNGNIYVAWHRAFLAGGSLADIGFTRSLDNGLTWSAAIRINSVVTGQQFFPQLAVNHTVGQIKVIYYSTQLSATNRFIDTYEVISNNHGATFLAPVRVTNSSFDRPTTNPNFDTIVASCYMGDYNANYAASSPAQGNTDFYLGWGDNRLDSNPGLAGVQPDPDIRFDRNVGVSLGGCYRSIVRVGSDVTLTWADLSDGETAYRIFRRAPGALTFTLIATLGANTTTFTNLSVLPVATVPDQPWRYQVQAQNVPQGTTFTLNDMCIP